jgi:acyl-CoA synthetase (AMP-forming)/AMP-acid ligase II
VWDEAAHGITTVITPTPWSAAHTLATFGTEQITVAQGVPTQWALLLALDGFDDAERSSLRIAGTGAARMEASMVRELRERLGVPVVVRYTSTESSLGTGTVPGDPDELVATTVGRPVPGVALELVDEDGAPVATGSVGRVRLRSGAVMRGYLKDLAGPSPAAGAPASPSPSGGAAPLLDAVLTASVLDVDGWVTTGDFGRLEDDGCLRLVGRANELYQRGGYNVYPAEVESVLTEHPAVSAAAVLGVPDPVLGEVGVAFVVPVPGSAAGAMDLGALRSHCAAALADYKAPDALVVVDALPLTPMMKIDKRALAGRAAEAAASRPRGSAGRERAPADRSDGPR